MVPALLPESPGGRTTSYWLGCHNATVPHVRESLTAALYVDAFAVGLQFPSVVDDSVKPERAMSDVEPSSHPYRK